MIIDIDVISYAPSLKTKAVQGVVHIWCKVRKKYIILQPEEAVRQLFIEHLIQGLGYSLSLIQVEKELSVHNVKKRYDIVVYDQQAQPYVLIECKRNSVKLNQQVMDQAAMYNSIAAAPYLIITNGEQCICCHVDHTKEQYVLMTSLPLPQKTS